MDYWTSVWRTVVAIAVGALIAWLTSRGIEVPADAEAGLVIALTGVVTALWYGIARALEKRWPWLGVLFGSLRQPEYRPKELRRL